MKNRSDIGVTRFSSPAYLRIQMDLRRRIQQGLWPVGAMLPSRKDLASEYGVSVPTVERAVSDLLEDGTIRADGGRGTFVASGRLDLTNQAGLEISDGNEFALSFQPSDGQPGSVPDQRSTWTIGVISYLEEDRHAANSSDRWIDAVIDSLERFITGAGGSTVFFNQRQTNGGRISIDDSIEALRETGVNAIAIVFAQDESEIARVVSKIERGLSIVFVNSSEITVPVLSVFSDSRQAGYLAAEHLLKRGFRDLLFFAPYTAGWVLQRAEGAATAVSIVGNQNCTLRIAMSPEPIKAVLTPAQHIQAAYEQAAKLLAGQPLSEAIVAGNDYIAYGFIQAANDIGLKMGKDYALVGFDDAPDSRYLGLTTLRPPLTALGEEAGKLLLRTLHGGNTDVCMCLHSHLVARSSSTLSDPARNVVLGHDSAWNSQAARG